MWIKIDTQLVTKPEVFQMSQFLQISRAEIVGHLVSVWSWFDQNSETGEIKGCCSMVDSITREGFANALVDCGWLSCQDNIITLPNFTKHNGATAKKRAQGQQRQERFRKKQPGNAQSVTREEKKREEIKKENTPFAKVVDCWNAWNDPKVTKTNDKRKALIRRICKEHTIQEIEEVFKKIPQIPFLTGDNDRGWRADFEYTMRPEKFLKILEGGWDAPGATTTTTAFNEWQ